MRLWFDANVCYKIDKCFRLFSRALLLFHRPLIIKTRKIVVILYSALCDTSYLHINKRISNGKNNHRKRNSESHISQNVSAMSWVSGRKVVLEGSFPNFNLTCKENNVHYSYSWICLVRQKCGWKCNCFDKWVKTLKCGWHPPDAGELTLLILT